MPRLQTVLAGGGDGEAVEVFWREARTAGTPLIAPAGPDCPDRFLVTFLWRAAAGSQPHNVCVSCYPGWDPLVNQLARLPGTDIWHKTYLWPSGTRISYHFVLDHPTLSAGQPWPVPALKHRDPLNLRPVTTLVDGAVSLVALPGAREPEWLAEHGSKRGRISRFQLRSAALGNERQVAVYTPAEAGPGQRWPLVVFLDGQWYEQPMRVFAMLDNLIAAGRIPPVAVAAVSSVDFAVRARELPCNPQFGELLAAELMPRLRADYPVALSPAATTIAGFSYGGLAAAYAAWQRPDVFGNVLSQSGSFWWGQPADDEGEWLTRLIATHPVRPLRWWLEVGLLETNSFLPRFVPLSTDIILQSNRHLRDVLAAKGYDCCYSEFPGGHDLLYWPITLPEALACVLRG